MKQPLAAGFGDGWDLLWEAQLHQHPAFSTCQWRNFKDNAHISNFQQNPVAVILQLHATKVTLLSWMIKFPKSVIFMCCLNCKKHKDSQFSGTVFRNQTLLIHTGLSMWKWKSENPVAIIHQSESQGFSFNQKLSGDFTGGIKKIPCYSCRKTA